MKIVKIGAAVVALAAFAPQTASADEVKVAMNGVEDLKSNSEFAFAVAFRDHLTKNGMRVKIFPSGSLGAEKERVAQVTQGLLQVNLASATSAASMSPMMRGLIMPFMFQSSGEFDQVLAKSELLAQMNKPLIANGLRIVGFNLRGLDAGIFNSKRPIRKLADLASLRMRALNKGQVAFYRIMGVRSTIVSWSEVSNALQTNIVDGYVNPPNSALRTGHTQFLKHYTPAALAPSFRAIMVSEDWWGGLNAKQKAVVEAGIRAGVKANRSWVSNWSKQVDARFKKAGVTVSQLAPGEREKMRALAVKVHQKVLKKQHLEAFAKAIATVRK